MSARSIKAYLTKVEQALEEYEGSTGRSLQLSQFDPRNARISRLMKKFLATPFPLDLGANDGQWMAVELGIKPLIREILPSNRWKEWKAQCENRGLFAQALPVGVAEDSGDGAIRKAPDPDDQNEEYGQFVAYAGRSQNAIDEALELEDKILEFGTHQDRTELALNIGKLLGYPQCCREHFAGFEKGNSNRVAIEKALQNSERLDPLLNNISFLNFHYIGWYPCRYDCQSSLDIAGQLDSHLKATFPEKQKNVRKILSMPRLYLDEQRQVIFVSDTTKENVVRYQDVLTPSQFVNNPESHMINWIFYVDVVADFLEGDEATFKDQEIIIIKSGEIIKRIYWDSIWLPFE